MFVSRRSLLRGGAAALVSAGLPFRSLGVLFPAVAGASETLTQSSFAACVNTSFRVAVGSRNVDVVLVKVTPGIKPSATGECFSLLFTGPANKPFDSGTYTVTHSSLGTFPLFIGPVGKPTKSAAYEAVFTRW
jgi:hypothetical protein